MTASNSEATTSTGQSGPVENGEADDQPEEQSERFASVTYGDEVQYRATEAHGFNYTTEVSADFADLLHQVSRYLDAQAESDHTNPGECFLDVRPDRTVVVTKNVTNTLLGVFTVPVGGNEDQRLQIKISTEALREKCDDLPSGQNADRCLGLEAATDPGQQLVTLRLQWDGDSICLSGPTVGQADAEWIRPPDESDLDLCLDTDMSSSIAFRFIKALGDIVEVNDHEVVLEPIPSRNVLRGYTEDDRDPLGLEVPVSIHTDAAVKTRYPVHELVPITASLAEDPADSVSIRMGNDIPLLVEGDRCQHWVAPRVIK